MPQAPAPRILLVEDDKVLAGLVSDYLAGNGMKVETCSTAGAAVRRVLTWKPDIVLLDIMLPDGTGLDVCRELRASWKGPVIFLTALGEDTDVVVGLELGADDYIHKPVSPRVLLARIRALLRRGSGDSVAETLITGPIRIDFASRTVDCLGAGIELTTAEFDLLALLAKRAGRVQERSRLVEELRGIDFLSFDRSVDVLVSRIRRKLEAAGGRGLIRTVRGVGYVLAPGTEEDR
jgi:two-component system, OmpR family, response regulator RstA